MLKDVSVLKIYMYANTVYFVNNLQTLIYYYMKKIDFAFSGDFAPTLLCIPLPNLRG